MLKFLLIFFIVIYLLGYFGRLIFSYWIKKVTNQSSEFNNFQQRKEGEVTITDNAKNTKRSNSNDGEYVDYEEIKE